MNVLSLLEQLAVASNFSKSVNGILKDQPLGVVDIFLNNDAESLKQLISKEYFPNESHVFNLES
jgi:hypothetical protein